MTDAASVDEPRPTVELHPPGWGVRTLATTDAAYNPIGCHRGTVWPHDNSIIVAGWSATATVPRPKRVAMGTAEAAAHFNRRLPEAWAGYPRAETGFPIEYPTACSPQAWSSGAALLFKRAMFGAEPQRGTLAIDPDIPESIGRVLHRRAQGIRYPLGHRGGGIHGKCAAEPMTRGSALNATIGRGVPRSVDRGSRVSQPERQEDLSSAVPASIYGMAGPWTGRCDSFTEERRWVFGSTPTFRR